MNESGGGRGGVHGLGRRELYHGGLAHGGRWLPRHLIDLGWVELGRVYMCIAGGGSSCRVDVGLRGMCVWTGHHHVLPVNQHQMDRRRSRLFERKQTVVVRKADSVCVQISSSGSISAHDCRRRPAPPEAPPSTTAAATIFQRVDAISRRRRHPARFGRGQRVQSPPKP